MQIKMRINGKIIHGELDNCAAARDFHARLPLTLVLDDYARTEKISDLTPALNTADAPSGYKPKAGDITFYAPWGNLAIFYRSYQYASGLVPLGRLSGDLQILKSAGSLEALIEKA